MTSKEEVGNHCNTKVFSCLIKQITCNFIESYMYPSHLYSFSQLQFQDNGKDETCLLSGLISVATSLLCRRKYDSVWRYRLSNA